MKKNVFQLMLLYLYDKYSKKDGKSLAILRGKALLLLPIGFLSMLLLLTMSKLFKIKEIENFLSAGKFSVEIISFCVILYLFISKLTYGKKTIASITYQKAEIQKGKKIFWIYFIGSIVILVSLTFVKKWYIN